MLELLDGGLHYVVPFLLILTALVFVHEFGHYAIARINGVKIEVFSIGFGPELFGWWDRAGTRWKFSALPLGGYVKMFGDADPSSTQPADGLMEMSEAERARSFPAKSLRQRAAIVAGGPASNFVFAVLLLAGLFMTYGEPYTPARIGAVEAGSAAAKAGMKPGDLIARINGDRINRFEDVQEAVRLDPGQPMTIVVERGTKTLTMHATPTMTAVTDRFGNHHEIGLLGIGRSAAVYVRRNPATALLRAGAETYNLSAATLTALWQIVTGARAADQLSGPFGIMHMSGEVAQSGGAAIIMFMAVLSINLGLINLFPVPVLDGGHLLFYAAEAIRGRPLGQRAQEYGFRIGLALVLTLMVFATWNDLVHLRIVAFVKGLVT
jgi:regulator of sigma E protease